MAFLTIPSECYQDSYIEALREYEVEGRRNEDLLRRGGHIGYTIRPSRRKQGFGTLILTHCLEQAKKLGLERVLLTCDEDNHASRTIIESNGGILENITQIQEWPAMVCYYWIQL